MTAGNSEGAIISGAACAYICWSGAGFDAFFWGIFSRFNGFGRRWGNLRVASGGRCYVNASCFESFATCIIRLGARTQLGGRRLQHYDVNGDDQKRSGGQWFPTRRSGGHGDFGHTAM